MQRAWQPIISNFTRHGASRGFFQIRKNKKGFGKSNKVDLGTVSSERDVPDHIVKPDYYYKMMRPGITLGTPEVKSLEQQLHMRVVCKLTAKILKACEEFCAVGKTTDEIDAYAHSKIIEANAYPSPLRYAGFPKSLCTSVNNVACHGIPDSRQLIDGDIVNIDISVYFNGYHGDCSKTLLVGNVDERGRFLVDATDKCLTGCIELCGPGVPFNHIGRFISKFCKENGLDTVHAFTGHGIGSYFHGPPEILHYSNNGPGVMTPGMTFTIEPILTLGTPDILLLEDGWTAVSADGARTAQFEHTILITEDGADILTK